MTDPSAAPSGEECDCCGILYAQTYHVPDELWAKVHEREPSGLLCLTCCDRRLQAMGFIPFWSCGAQTTTYPERHAARKALEDAAETLENEESFERMSAVDWLRARAKEMYDE